MLILITKKVTAEEIKNAASDIENYIKVVVDIERNILSAGGAWHVEGEQLLLKEGSRQQDLWGGGLDLETNGIDFDSMINIRPADGNTSREVLSETIRKKMTEIIRTLLK